jgi:hypothetical protein
MIHWNKYTIICIIIFYLIKIRFKENLKKKIQPFGSGIVDPQPFVECVPAGKVDADTFVAL